MFIQFGAELDDPFEPLLSNCLIYNSNFKDSFIMLIRKISLQLTTNMLDIQ